MPNESQEKGPKWISLSGLKARGWTPGNVKTFLGEPELLVKNPHFRSASPMKLFLLDKALRVEESVEFKEWQLKHASRRKKLSELASQNMKNLRQSLYLHIDTLKIKIPCYSREYLTNRAIRAYNDLWSDRGEEKSASLNSPKSFLERISVNFLRHECTNYEYEIDRMFGKVGRIEGYYRLKKRVLMEISIKYPFLKNECNSQINVDQAPDSGTNRA